MTHSHKLIGSIRFYMMVFISAAIVVLLLFILYIMSPNIPNAYASSSSNDSRLTIIETGTVPSDAGTNWEYTLYSIKLGEGYSRYYIEYYNSMTKDIKIEQIIDGK